METKGFFQCEIMINVLVTSFRFIRIPVLWVYDHYTYFNFFSAWIDFRFQNLTANSVPALKEVILGQRWPNIKSASAHVSLDLAKHQPGVWLPQCLIKARFINLKNNILTDTL